MLEGQPTRFVKPLFAKHMVREAVASVFPKATVLDASSTPEQANQVEPHALIEVWQARMAIVSGLNLPISTGLTASPSEQPITIPVTSDLDKTSLLVNYSRQTLEVIQWAQNLLTRSLEREGKEEIIQDSETTVRKLETYGSILENPNPKRYSQSEIYEARTFGHTYSEQHAALNPDLTENRVLERHIGEDLIAQGHIKYRKKFVPQFLEMMSNGSNLVTLSKVNLIQNWLDWEFNGLVKQGEGYGSEPLDFTLLTIQNHQVEARFHGKRLLKPDDNMETWRSENAARLTDILFQVIDDAKLDIIYPDAGLQSSRAWDFPTDQVQPIPTVWLEYSIGPNRKPLLTREQYEQFLYSNDSNHPLKLIFHRSAIENLSNDAVPLRTKQKILQSMANRVVQLMEKPKPEVSLLNGY